MLFSWLTWAEPQVWLEMWFWLSRSWDHFEQGIYLSSVPWWCGKMWGGAWLRKPERGQCWCKCFPLLCLDFQLDAPNCVGQTLPLDTCVDLGSKHKMAMFLWLLPMLQQWYEPKETARQDWVPSARKNASGPEVMATSQSLIILVTIPVLCSLLSTSFRTCSSPRHCLFSIC